MRWAGHIVRTDKWRNACENVEKMKLIPAGRYGYR